MDLSFTDDERACAAEVRGWLDANVELPSPFASVDDEVAWGRRWQAKLAEGRKASSIAGGTSEVQRTIIGERLLGLPRG